MAIKRITISVPEEVASRILRAARKEPVSSWVTRVIEEHLDDAELQRLWEEFYRDVSPRLADVERARTKLARLVRAPRRRSAA